MLEPKTFKKVQIIDEASLLAYSRELPPQEPKHWWLFRGMPRNFPLQTSLERALIDADIGLEEAPQIERKLLKEFKRRAHFYVDPLPAQGDVLGWLALMQHYGAPTRLLDWTYSFFVAAFFALGDAVSNPVTKREPAVVWALFRAMRSNLVNRRKRQKQHTMRVQEIALGKQIWGARMGTTSTTASMRTS